MAAGADGGVLALGGAGAGDGALHARDAGGEPDEAEAGPEIANVATTPAQGRRKTCVKTNTVIFLGLTLSF